MKKFNIKNSILKEINESRELLNEKIEQNKKFEEILKISKEIDILVSTYYRAI